MTLLTFEPPIGPSPGTSHKPKVNINETEFGDGYNQSSPKGLNHIRKNVSLEWSALTYAQMASIVDFFEGQGGTQPFYYRPYGERYTLKWTCKEWDFTASNGVWVVTATLTQSFTNEI